MKKVLNKKLLIFSLVILVPGLLSANFIGMNWGARPMALGETYVGLANDPSAVFWNPAGLSYVNTYSILASHQNLYEIGDLYNQMVAVSIPLKFVHLGAGWSQINLLNEYAEQVIAVSAASIIWYKNIPIRFGLSLDNYSLRVPGYDDAKDASKFDIDAGLITTPLKNFSIGFVARNIFEPSIKLLSENEKLNRNFTLGTHYRWRDVVNFLLDYQWDKDESSVHFGWEIWFFDVFAPRIGLNREYLTVGFGLKAKHWNLDGAVYSHEELGSTYRVSFGLQF
ncbi:MAG: conjugal transfer protein TraF [Candidatus Cloacimonetes bacterium]|nr:conjugal transfer protein TraF [Candidatus Cloacimonadota bacterium]